MKKLKKSLMAAFLTAAMVLCTFAGTVPTDAATLTADQYLKKMTQASAKVKSYEATTTTVQNMIADGDTMNAKTVQKVISFVKPMKAKGVSTTTMSVNGKRSKAKSYTYIRQNAKGKIISYVSLDGKKYEKMDMSSYVDSLSSIDTEMYSNAKIVKENVKVNNVNTVQISAQITGEDLGKAMATVFSAIGMGSGSDSAAIDYSNLKSVNATIWVDKKTYLPVKITTNMTAFMNSYMTILTRSMQDMGVDGATDVNLSYTKAVATQIYTNYNKATNFKLPKACR